MYSGGAHTVGGVQCERCTVGGGGVQCERCTVGGCAMWNQCRVVLLGVSQAQSPIC